MMKDNNDEKFLLNYVPVYVLLPLFGLVAKHHKDVELETIKEHLKCLKDNAHIDGVMVDVWWGIVEPESPNVYNWNTYIDLFELVESLGLRIYAIMSFHKGTEETKTKTKTIDLPKWVLDVGNQHPDIYYTNPGKIRNMECLSLGVDDQPLFGGANGKTRTAIEIYSDFMSSFKKNMKKFLDAGVIVAVQVGLGPSGELCYPSFPKDPDHWEYPGIGEFQCYDKYLRTEYDGAAEKKEYRNLESLKSEFGHYKSDPDEPNFFKENGTYTKPEGKFFLEWYSTKLILHGDKILREANKIFAGLKVELVAKVSGVHWWYNHPSHAAELTAGYYNLFDRDGYRPIARMLYKRNCFLNFSCLDMKNPDPNSLVVGKKKDLSAPHDLVKAVLSKAWKEGIGVIGGNTWEIKDAQGYNQVLFNARPNGFYDKDKPRFIKVHSFVYLRLSETIFKKNYDMFKNFVRNMHAGRDYCGDAEKFPHEVDSDSEITNEEILAATKPSGSFEWNSETIMKVAG